MHSTSFLIGLCAILSLCSTSLRGDGLLPMEMEVSQLLQPSYMLGQLYKNNQVVVHENEDRLDPKDFIQQRTYSTSQLERGKCAIYRFLDKKVDEVEGLFLIEKSGASLLDLFTQFDSYEKYEKIHLYINRSIQISENHLRQRFPDKANFLTGWLKENEILPIPEDVYYQFSDVQVGIPEFQHTLRFEVKRFDKTVSRGKGAEEKIIENVPTVRVYWMIDPRFDNHEDFYKEGISINSGYLELQPYITDRGEVLDGPGGFPGPEKFVTLLNYHIYVKFDPSTRRKNDITRWKRFMREKFIGDFIEALVDFLRTTDFPAK